MFLFLWWFHYTGEKFKNPCTRLKLRQLKIFVSSWPIYLNLNLKATLKRFADKFKQYMQPLKRIHILPRDFFHKLLFVSSMLSFALFSHFFNASFYSLIKLLSANSLLSNLLIGSLKSYNCVINNAQVWGGNVLIYFLPL